MQSFLVIYEDRESAHLRAETPLVARRLSKGGPVSLLQRDANAVRGEAESQFGWMCRAFVCGAGLVAVAAAAVIRRRGEYAGIV